MSRSPVVLFGFCVADAALKARAGQCRVRDRLALADAVLRQVPGDGDAIAAVSRFLSDVVVDQPRAGAHLSAFLSDWLDRQVPRVSEEVISGPDAVPLFEWQKRADLQ